LVCCYVVARHILGSIVRAFGVARLLVLAKLFGGIRSIVVCEVLNILIDE
jgi:hypothetical protein